MNLSIFSTMLSNVLACYPAQMDQGKDTRGRRKGEVLKLLEIKFGYDAEQQANEEARIVLHKEEYISMTPAIGQLVEVSLIVFYLAIHHFGRFTLQGARSI